MPQSSLASVLNFQIFFLGATALPFCIYACQRSQSACPTGDLQTKPGAAWAVERQPADSHAWSLHGECGQSLSGDGPGPEEARVSQGVAMCRLQAMACYVASRGCLVHHRRLSQDEGSGRVPGSSYGSASCGFYGSHLTLNAWAERKSSQGERRCDDWDLWGPLQGSL